MHLQIFCPKCYPDREILEFSSEDRVLDCRCCRSRFFLRTVLVDKYKSGQVFKKNSWSYRISGVGPDEVPEILNFQLEGPTNVRVGDLVSEIKEKGKVIALVNHSTGSWTETKKETINVFQDRYLTALKIITLATTALVSLSWGSAILNNPKSAAVAVVVAIGVVILIVLLMTTEGALNQKKILRETASWLKSLSK